MACECKNEDGTLSQTCRGCQHIIDRISSQNSFTGKQLSQIQEIVNHAFSSLNDTLDEKWIDGFITGFHKGISHEQKY